MKVNWVLSNEIKPALADIELLKSIAPLWGSYSTWKQYKTDNCVCNDLGKSQELIKRAFHAVCNLYVPQDSFVELGRPSGLKLFGGAFDFDEFQYKDDIVALWLASTDADIVLLLGFDLQTVTDHNGNSDFKDKATRKGYYNSIAKVIKDRETTQFVLVDYEKDLSPIFDNLPNLTEDTIEAVKELLI